ncbi:DNA-packaging protein FI, partial [Escherichia coli]
MSGGEMPPCLFSQEAEMATKEEN